MSNPFRKTEVGQEEQPLTNIGGFRVDQTGMNTDNLKMESGGPNTAKIIVGRDANSGGINSADKGTDIVFWAGSTHPNRATAPFRVNAQGDMVATSVTITNPADVQTFLGNGTWTKPETGSQVRVQVWGGGGGGGNGGLGGGGAGGAYHEFNFLADDLAATVAVTVGASGAINTAGGNTSFGSHLLAYGGGAGGASAAGASGGGGGGQSSAGTSAVVAVAGDGGGPLGGLGGTVADDGASSIFGGGGGGDASGGNGGASVYGGGGGGASSANGGSSLYGGGGGAGSGGAAGASTFGGNGGAPDVAGSVPGGGGGGANGAAGGAGKCIITTF